MDKEEINKLEEYILKSNIELYKLINSKIKKEFNKLIVSDLADYFSIAQELDISIKKYLKQKKEQNKIKETFKNHK